jgi:iron-sulfur cluster repair protein YtfE (RIC family)
MTTITQPLREEHQSLWPHIEALAGAAGAIGEAPIPAVLAGIDAAYDFLAHHLIPHAEAEERVLYPAVQKAMNAPEATATMSRDHVEVGRLTEHLGELRARMASADKAEPLSSGDARELRRLLYGLSALITVHFAKEEEIYLPLLDARLGKAEAAHMFEAMETAAAVAKARHASR